MKVLLLSSPLAAGETKAQRQTHRARTGGIPPQAAQGRACTPKQQQGRSPSPSRAQKVEDEAALSETGTVAQAPTSEDLRILDTCRAPGPTTQ